MAWKTLDDLELDGKAVLTRVDINVPVEAGQVTDATRIERIVPTIRDILAKGGNPVLLAHFGRPKGKVVPEMSLRVTLGALEAALGAPVRFSAECVGAEAKAAVAALTPGEVPAFGVGDRLHCAYKLNRNRWRGRESLQLMVEHAKAV